MNTCPAIKADGEVCGKRCREGNPRCGTHMRSLENKGPHSVARDELTYRQRAILRQANEEGERAIQEATDPIVRRNLRQDLNHRINTLQTDHTREMTLLIRAQEDEIRETGIDPDARARERQWNIAQERRARWDREFNERNNLDQNVQAQQAALAMVEQFIQNQNQNQENNNQELRRLANDNQNVHTTVVVRQTKEIIDRILKIPVPTEYQWNMRECSKTPGDIIINCKLTPKGAWQMSSKYCQDENIYEFGKGIYGKVLDSVWQYILKSQDKEDLCKILKQEMEDNIGMCAQGNLTRLCNILSGYMEGVGVQESVTEILGRKLPKLMEIDNVEERLSQATIILTELNVPLEQWESWISPLVDYDPVTIQANGAGQVIINRV